MKKINITKSLQRGFTLIEILTSITVLVAVGAIMTGVISSVLRGANKTSNIEVIRENGNYAISQISKNIQFAKVFDGFSTDNTSYVTSCVNPTNPTEYEYVKVTLHDDSQVMYRCESNGRFTTNGTSVVNTASVSFSSCSITCTQKKSSDVPIVGINFELEPLNSSVLVENSTPPIPFETSVTVRNYRR